MIKKLCVLLLLFSIMLVTSCTAQPATTSPPDEVEEMPTEVPEPTSAEAMPVEKVELELWQGEAWSACVREYIDEYINPNAETYQVKVVDTTPGISGRSAIAAGGGPDIVTESGPTTIREYALAGLISPLDDYAQKYGWEELFAPWALEMGDIEGTLYSLPAELETMVLFYNKTLFENKGYQPPNTFDEMVALAEQMEQDGIIPFASAVGDTHWPTDYVYAEYLNAIAGPDAVYEALTGKRSWTDPVFVETFQELHDQAVAGWFMGGLDSYFTKTWDEQWAAVASGEAGMTVQGTWMFQNIDDYFEETGNAWDFVPIPRKEGSPVFGIGLGSAWGINHLSEHPDEAAEFLNTWFSPEHQLGMFKTFCRAAGPVTIPESAMDDFDPRVATVFQLMNQAFAEGNYGYTTWTFWPPELQLYMQTGLEEIYNDQLSIDDYLQEADEILQKELADGSAPVIPER